MSYRRPPFPFVMNEHSPQAEGLNLWLPFSQPGQTSNFRDFANNMTVVATNFQGSDWQTDTAFGHILEGRLNDQHRLQVLNPTDDLMPITVTAWVNVFSVFDFRLYMKGNTNGQAGPVFIIPETGAPGPFGLTFRKGWDTAQGSYAEWNTMSLNILEDRWHHIGVTYTDETDTHSAIFFVDGETQITTQTRTPGGASLSDAVHSLYILQNPAFDRGLTGAIFDLRVYKGFHPDGEIIRHAFNPMTRWDLYKPYRRKLITFPDPNFKDRLQQITECIFDQ